MTRILFLCTGLESHGGIQRFNRNLVRAWTDLGLAIDVLSLSDSGKRADASPLPDSVYVRVAKGNKFWWVIQLALLLTTKRYDRIVCGHVHLASITILLVTLRFFDFRRSILILHGIEIWNRVNGAKRIAARRFGRVLSVSQYTADSFLSQVPLYSRERVALLPNTINLDLANYQPRTKHPSNQQREFRILSVTRLSVSERDKGLLDVFSALANMTDSQHFKYEIVGDGDDRAFLEATVAQLGLSTRVTFCGALSDNELWRAYERADIFVLPSRKEGFGIVYLEAMRFGLPVIAAREKGAVDVVRDDINGFLVPYGDVPCLQQRLSDLACNKELRIRLGQAGQSLVEPGGEFSFESFRDRCRKWFVDA